MPSLSMKRVLLISQGRNMLVSICNWPTHTFHGALVMTRGEIRQKQSGSTL